MADFLTQPEWAERCGVSMRTFYNWRVSGVIPEPDIEITGRLRWSAALVEKTMRSFRRPKVGRPLNLSRRRNGSLQPLPSRRVKRDRSLEGADVSAEDVGVLHDSEFAAGGR